MNKKIAGILVLVVGLYFSSSSLLLIYYVLSKKEPSNFVKGFFSPLHGGIYARTWEQVKMSGFYSLWDLGFTFLGIFLMFSGLRAIFNSEIDKNLIKKLQDKIKKDNSIT